MDDMRSKLSMALMIALTPALGAWLTADRPEKVPPAKAVLASRGLMNASVRPPLVVASDATRDAALEAIKAFEEA